MNSVCKWCVILSLATGAVAQADGPPSKTRKPSTTITAADVKALKDAVAAQGATLAQLQAAMAAQQLQIQELRDELHRKNQAATESPAPATQANDGRAAQH